MPKLGEINYVKAIGTAASRHVLDKPFSTAECGRYLVDLGLVLDLLPPPPARVLDLGVGPGWTSVFLAKRGYEVVGQDICADMVELAERNRDRYEADAASFVVGDYEGLGFRDEFDAAVFYDALHHAEDERAALAAVFAALRPGGVCITVEPGEGHAAASADLAASYGVTEKDMPPHHVVSVGREVGFRSFRVYGRAIGPRLVCGFGPQGPLWPHRPDRWRTAFCLARRAFKTLLCGPREDDRDHLFRLPPEAEIRKGNIVWMRK